MRERNRDSERERERVNEAGRTFFSKSRWTEAIVGGKNMMFSQKNDSQSDFIP